MRAAREVLSTSSTRPSSRRSTVTAALCRTASRIGSTPPTTLDPPPNGVTLACAPPAQSSTAATSASVRG
jgi:hypothetical protein